MKTYKYFGLALSLFLGVSCFQGSYAQDCEDDHGKGKRKWADLSLSEIISYLREHRPEQFEKAKKYAKRKGWKLYERTPDGEERELQHIGPDGTLLYYTTYNENVVDASRADYLYNNSLIDLPVTGEGMQVGIWDSGHALLEHQEFQGRIVASDKNRRSSGHATHIAGTILASGADPTARGVAYKASGLTYDWTMDEAEAAEAAQNGLLISNHSYGLSGRSIPDWYFGAYIYQARDWDAIMYNAPYYLMVTAAGNTRQEGYNRQPVSGAMEDGYDQLLGFANAKNVLTVAAAASYGIDADGNLSEATIADFSNFGPTDDGRIKPDITGAGVQVYSSFADSPQSYRTLSGTSMAAPGVSGVLTLLQQLHKDLNGTPMKAATLKGLVLHTADDAGLTGPDPQFGWGVINARKASDLIALKDFSSLILEDELQSGTSFTTEVTANENEPLQVSLSWTDLPFEDIAKGGDLNRSSSVLVHDLDLRITNEEGTVYEPWKLLLSQIQSGAVTGDNSVDPFERIDINLPKGNYVITVSHKGSLTKSSQPFSLLVSGVKLTTCEPVAPVAPEVSELGMEQATLSWDASSDAMFEFQYREAGVGALWNSRYTSENTWTLDNLKPDTTYEVQLVAYCSEIIASDPSPVFQFRTQAPPLSAPTGLQANYLGEGDVTLEWEHLQSNKEIEVYRIYQNGVLLGEVAETSFVVTNLIYSKIYSFSVDAVATDGTVSLLSEPLVYQLPVVDHLARGDEDLTETVASDDPGIMVAQQSGTVRIFGVQNNTSLQYQLTDLSGRTFAQGTQEAGSTIDVSAIPSGMYVMKVTEGTDTKTVKFSKR